MWERHGQESSHWETPKSSRLDADCYWPANGPDTITHLATPSPQPSVEKNRGDKQEPTGHEATPESVGGFSHGTPEENDLYLSDDQRMELEKVLKTIEAFEDTQHLAATPNSEVSGPQLL